TEALRILLVESALGLSPCFGGVVDVLDSNVVGHSFALRCCFLTVESSICPVAGPCKVRARTILHINCLSYAPIPSATTPTQHADPPVPATPAAHPPAPSGAAPAWAGQQSRRRGGGVFYRCSCSHASTASAAAPQPRATPT